MRSRALLLTLWASGTCSSVAAPAPGPAQDTQTKPQAEVEASPEAQPGVSVAEADAPAEAPPNVEEKALEAAPQVPTKKEALIATKAVVQGKLAQLAPIIGLADGRAAVVWRNQNGEHEQDATAVLVILKHESAAWAADGTHELIDLSTPWLEGPPPMAATLRSDDYDDDGKPEILVRLRYPLMCPGGGPNTVTSLDILDVSAAPKVALSTELNHLMDAYPEEETKAKVTHEDTNGDGHRDVKIVYVSPSNDGPTTKKTNVWVYEKEGDAWSLTKPNYARWGCDW